MRTMKVKDLIKELGNYASETPVVVSGNDHSFNPIYLVTRFADITKNSMTESDDETGTLVLVIEG